MGDILYRPLIHHYDPMYLALRRDYCRLFKDDKFDTKARLIRLLEWKSDRASERWQDEAFLRAERGEPVGQEPDHRVEASYRWFMKHCYGFISRDTVKKYLEELERDGWIKQYPNPKYGAPLYWLNYRKLQKELKKLFDAEQHGQDGDSYLETIGEEIPEEYDDDDEGAPPVSVKHTPRGGGKLPTPPETSHPPRNFPPGGKNRGRGEKQGGVGSLPPGGKHTPRGVGSLPPGGWEVSGGRGGKFTPSLKNLVINSNNNREESSSSVLPDEETESQPEMQEEEEISPLFEKNLETNLPEQDDDEPTETQPIVSRHVASSSIGVTQATGKQAVIPSRPGSEKQARCDGLASKLQALRGFALTNEATVFEQNKAIRDLVGTYSDEDIAWILVYAASFSQYKGVKPGPRYASILLEVAPDAMAAATDPEVRKMLVQSATLVPASPAQSNGKAMQRATEPPTQRATSEYSGEAQRERQRQQAEMAKQQNGRH